jgi:hypothetical protein
MWKTKLSSMNCSDLRHTFELNLSFFSRCNNENNNVRWPMWTRWKQRERIDVIIKWTKQLKHPCTNKRSVILLTLEGFERQEFQKTDVFSKGSWLKNVAEQIKINQTWQKVLLLHLLCTYTIFWEKVEGLRKDGRRLRSPFRSVFFFKGVCTCNLSSQLKMMICLPFLF